MQTVDKTKARADALEMLGLDSRASSNDIRDAWRDIAFRAHPDHAGSDHAEFARAKAAYDFLRDEGLTTHGDDARLAQPRRPRLRSRVLELSEEEIADCQAMLYAGLPITNNAETQNLSDAETAACDTPSDHVPNAIGRYGRNLTYFVQTPVSLGANRVALPTSVLTNSRQTETEVLSFQSKNAGAGQMEIPETIRQSKFPGAKSVRILFEADQDTRNRFEVAH